MMLLLPKFLAGYSGAYVDAYGYANFFTATALLGLPVIVLLWFVARIAPATKQSREPSLLAQAEHSEAAAPVRQE
jgi:PAT family beta-lactamase induction signal transducer AmpG